MSLTAYIYCLFVCLFFNGPFYGLNFNLRVVVAHCQHAVTRTIK